MLLCVSKYRNLCFACLWPAHLLTLFTVCATLAEE